MGSFTLANMLTKTRTSQAPNDERIALSFGERSFTYEALDERAERLAVGLLAAGFAKGDRVCIVARNRPEWIELFFALAKISGVLVPVNYLLKAKEVQYMIEDSGAAWVVCEDEFWHSIEEIRPIMRHHITYVSLDGEHADSVPYGALLAEGNEKLADVEVGLEDLFLLQYTSGTTGFPKGAMHTHATVLWNAMSQISDFEITRDDVTLVVPALCWAAGFHDFALSTLWVGGQVVLNPSQNFEPARFCETVERHRVTRTLLVPSVLKRVLGSDALERHDVSSLRMVLSGGEPVPVAAIEQLHARLPTCTLVQGYGMSEFPALMLYLPPEDAVPKAGSAGKSCLVAEIRVVNETNEDTEPGEVGEIICRSPASMVGYYGKPEETAKTLTDGWLRTGDLAHVDEDGYVYIAGRSKDMIITGGLNVYPAEVERVIGERDDVIEAAVVGAPDDGWGEIGHAFVVVEAGTELSPEKLEEHCRRQLANFKVPRRWTVQEKPLPRTTSGKVQKFLLTGVEA